MSYSPGGPCNWCKESTHTAVLEFSFIKDIPGNLSQAEQLNQKKVIDKVRDGLRARKERAEAFGQHRCLSSIPSYEFMSDLPHGMKQVLQWRNRKKMFKRCPDVDTPMQFCNYCLPLLKRAPIWYEFYWDNGA